MKVTVGGRSQIDEVMSGSSYYSQNDLRLHFGLGARRDGGQRRDRLAVRRQGDAARSARQSASSSSRKTKGIVESADAWQ